MIDMMWGVGIAMQRMHIWANVSSPMELVGVHQLACSWRPRAHLRRLIIGIYKPSSIVWRSPHSYACMIWKSLWSTNILWSTSVDLSKRNSSVAPFSLFISFFLSFFYFFVFLWPHWLFLFISHLSSLGSFHVSSFGIFYLCPLWDLFLTLRATLYILQGWRRSTLVLQSCICTS